MSEYKKSWFLFVFLVIFSENPMHNHPKSCF